MHTPEQPVIHGNLALKPIGTPRPSYQKSFTTSRYIKNALIRSSQTSLEEAFAKSVEKIEFDQTLGEKSQLKDTGFDLGLEVRRFFTNLNNQLEKTSDLSTAALSSYYELDANLRTFAREFIQGGAVLPMLIEEQSGQIVNSYDKQRVVDKITEKERLGAVKFASEKVEQNFAQNHGQIIDVVNSPAGWTGFYDKEGNDFVYRDTQSLVFWRGSDGKLRGVTIVSDMTREQGKQFLGILGVDQQKLSGQDEKAEIVNMIQNPAEIRGSERFKKPEDIVEALIEVRGEGDMRFHLLDGTTRTVTVEQLRKDIRRIDELLSFDGQTESLLGELKQFILKDPSRLQDPNFQAEVAKNIELVVLGITRSINQAGQKKSDNQAEFSAIPTVALTLDSLKQADFTAEKAHLAKQAGCSKGIVRSTSAFFSSLGQAIGGGSGFSWGGGGGSSGETCKDCGIRPPMEGGCGWCEPCGNKPR